MGRFFNTTGPCDPERHYMLPPKERLVGASIDRYIGDQLYWVLHAPRQTGKTTFLRTWMREINASAEAVACYVSVERCQEVPEAERAMPNIVEAVAQWAGRNDVPAPPVVSGPPETIFNKQMAEWAAITAPRPLVVLFDEVDVLEGPAMVSFLRQLRDGFAGRGVGKFPVSVALVGMRDLRDYLVRSKDGRQLNPGSPFNVKHDSATLGNFARRDIVKLVAQHTAENGQVFSDGAVDRIWELTSGQPWLVNALCDKLVSRIVPQAGKAAVMTEHVERAKEMVIESRATHIDSLSMRLREPRVRRVVQPIITGEIDPLLAEGDDFTFCCDLGLVALDKGGTVKIANAIYREVLARDLSFGMQAAIPEPEFQWRRPDGALDMDALLRGFQKFWRRHSDTWEAKADYTEAFPHLLLMAYLQRVANGGGSVDREFAAGRGRVDIVVTFAGRVSLVEIKLVRAGDARGAVMEEGLEQIAAYSDRVKADTRHLVLFDRRPEWRAKPWEERLGWEERTAPGGKLATIVWT